MPDGPSRDDSADGIAVRADLRLRGSIVDIFLADDARLDERTRLAIVRQLTLLIDGVESDLRRQGARLLAGRGQADAAAALLAGQGSAMARLSDTGVLRDAALMDELIARTRAGLIAEALPVVLDEGDRPSFLVALGEQGDSVVAGAARALLAAESRHGAAGGELPGEVFHRLVWWVAAVLRDGGGTGHDSALAEAAQRCLGAIEGDRTDALAVRLAAALDPLPGELPALLVAAIGDRRLALFVALLARGAGIDHEAARALVLDVDDDRLWLALRALGLKRDQIARVGLSLAEADPRRDIEAFADRLDPLMATTVEAALAAIEPLRLPRAFRAAIVEVSRA